MKELEAGDGHLAKTRAEGSIIIQNMKTWMAFSRPAGEFYLI